MSLIKYIERLKRMDDLIQRKATGTPDEFAEKLGISKSMLMINLTEMKEMGAQFKYDFSRQTYCYLDDCKLKLEFEIGKEQEVQIKGGWLTDYQMERGYVNKNEMKTDSLLLWQ